MTPEQIDEIPIYLAFILLGAISPDHENLRLSEKDMALYQMALRRKAMKRE